MLVTDPSNWRRQMTLLSVQSRSDIAKPRSSSLIWRRTGINRTKSMPKHHCSRRVGRDNESAVCICALYHEMNMPDMHTIIIRVDAFPYCLISLRSVAWCCLNTISILLASSLLSGTWSNCGPSTLNNMRSAHFASDLALSYCLCVQLTRVWSQDIGYMTRAFDLFHEGCGLQCWSGITSSPCSKLCVYASLWSTVSTDV